MFVIVFFCKETFLCLQIRGNNVIQFTMVFHGLSCSACLGKIFVALRALISVREDELVEYGGKRATTS